ncbi:EAL domain-containing protein [Halobacillus sp. Nhm2S1]|uniref:EAL domain-containing protein n=1 Tax=Halobacillus sp. Nhm2S1 TaxID=2866716 RepID=UPI001C738924|nr:EAL domain-containing protein [Halobacillus sp. Nhm2S1]MBX0357689.1 EAL domain-containing protein [Halobacillus sp. Nhm2S1]
MEIKTDYSGVEIIPLYQPIIDVKEKRIVGFEATTKGRIESTNEEVSYDKLKECNIDNLDFHARDIAVNEFELYEDYKLFVNITPKELVNPLFYEDIDITRLVLEITEDSTYPEEEEWRILQRIDRLKEVGLDIAVDDLGKQNSNIDTISTFKPRIIKMDMGAKNKEPAIAKGYLMQNEYEVVIEGIEDEEEYKEWLNAGCRYMQGFYFAKPMEYKQLISGIATRKLLNHIKSIIE